MSRAGFTLLEVLLAVVLTATVAVAAMSLTAVQARVGTAARAQEAAVALATETVRLIDDDLVLAVAQPGHGRVQLETGGVLRLVTSARLPGEAPGLREVVWRFDAAAGAAVRTSAMPGTPPTSRRVGGGWTAFAIAADRDGMLWLNGRIGGGQPWSLPLWTEEP